MHCKGLCDVYSYIQYTYMKHFTCTLEQINSVQITTARQIWATEYKCIYEGRLSGLANAIYGSVPARPSLSVFLSSFFFFFFFAAFVYHTEPCIGKLKKQGRLGNEASYMVKLY